MSKDDYLSKLESDFQSYRNKFRHGKIHNIPQKLKQQVFFGIGMGIGLDEIHKKTGLRLVTLKSWKSRYVGEEADVRLLKVQASESFSSEESVTLIWPNGLKAHISLKKLSPELISRLGGCA